FLSTSLSFDIRAALRSFPTRRSSDLRASKWAVILSACLFFLAIVTGPQPQAQENLLKNPGFEEAASKENSVPNWTNLAEGAGRADRKSTRLNSSHQIISYAVFCLKKK